MLKSNFIVREYSGNQKIELKNVISIEAFNNSDVVAVVDKFVIEPGKRVFVVSPDCTNSNLTLDLYFVPIPIQVIEDDDIQGRPSENIGLYSILDGVIPAKIAPELKQTVVLYIKSLQKFQ